MNKHIIISIVSLLVLVCPISAEEKLTIKDFSISAGETKSLNIELENEGIYAGFQFDLYLPDGLTITEYSANRKRVPDGTSVTMAKQDDGTYRFIGAATELDDLMGNSGSIIMIKVVAGKDLTGGNLKGSFRNVKLSKADGTGVTYPEMFFPIIVNASIISGDAYSDNAVNAKDVVSIVEYMMGKKPDKFNVEAADMNKNTLINIVDVILLVNQIFYE